MRNSTLSGRHVYLPSPPVSRRNLTSLCASSTMQEPFRWVPAEHKRRRFFNKQWLPIIDRAGPENILLQFYDKLQPASIHFFQPAKHTHTATIIAYFVEAKKRPGRSPSAYPFFSSLKFFVPACRSPFRSEFAKGIANRPTSTSQRFPEVDPPSRHRVLQPGTSRKHRK